MMGRGPVKRASCLRPRRTETGNPHVPNPLVQTIQGHCMDGRAAEVARPSPDRLSC